MEEGRRLPGSKCIHTPLYSVFPSPVPVLRCPSFYPSYASKLCLIHASGRGGSEAARHRCRAGASLQEVIAWTAPAAGSPLPFKRRCARAPPRGSRQLGVGEAALVEVRVKVCEWVKERGCIRVSMSLICEACVIT